MTSDLKSRSNSLSKLNEEVDKLISSEKNKNEENLISLKKFFEEEDYNINEIPNDIDKKVLEMAEKRDFELANSKKYKSKKKELDILNEQLEDLIKKTINESKAETKGTDSLSKKSKIKQKRNRLIKHRKDTDEDFDDSIDNDNKSISSFMNSNSNYSYINDNSSYYGDEKELMEFINKKTCQKKNIKKYQLKYKNKNKNRKNNLIVINDDDEEDLEYYEEIDENNNSEDVKEEINSKKNKKKHLKRLKKNSDNKEMKLPLDTECIICCCVIKELANPDGCNHDFCKSCLIEWSQRSSKCPMCKKLYFNIFIYDNGIKKQLSLNEIRHKYKSVILENNDEESNNNNNNEEEENNSEDDNDEGCYICGKDTDQANLLVCDRCGGNYCHYYCNNLDKIPEGKWYCAYCLQKIKEIKENKKKVGHFFL